MAKESYERVLRQNPNHSKVQQQLGWLYHQNTSFSNQDTAIEFLNASLASGAPCLLCCFSVCFFLVFCLLFAVVFVFIVFVFVVFGVAVAVFFFLVLSRYWRVGVCVCDFEG